METKIGKELLEHKKEVVKGFKESFDFILELEKKPEKIEKLPKRGTLVKRGKRFSVRSEDRKKIVLI
jgi:hypothetical protein